MAKSKKRSAAAKKAYKKSGGLKAYNKSPKYKKKRSAAAKKAAKTRARNKKYGKKPKTAKKAKSKKYKAKKKKSGKKKGAKKYGKKKSKKKKAKYARVPKAEAQAARLARRLAKSKRPIVVSAPALSSHQSSYMAGLREKYNKAKAHIPSWWAS